MPRLPEQCIGYIHTIIDYAPPPPHLEHIQYVYWSIFKTPLSIA